jgi:hypothetical protein
MRCECLSPTIPGRLHSPGPADTVAEPSDSTI